VWAGYYNGLVNVEYYKLLLKNDDNNIKKKDLLVRWTELTDKWKKLWETSDELSYEYHNELYMTKWKIEHDEDEPNFDLLYKAQENIDRNLGFYDSNKKE
jgi:hypothetical protein